MPKKKIVLSGVNMVEGGILTIFRKLILELSKRDDCDIVCLVNSEGLFDKSTNVNFIEYPEVKKSWARRIFFEYIQSWFLSKKIKPDVWVCLHDMTANTYKVKRKIVYCHNPSPFYKSNLNEFKLDKKFYLFTKFYKYLYKINIKKNNAVIVQQEWIKNSFNRWFGVDNVYVSRPEISINPSSETINVIDENLVVNLLYPAVPRVFKNFDILIQAMSELKNSDITKYENTKLRLTFGEGFNSVGDDVIRKVKELGLDNIIFTGFLTKEILNEEYKVDNTILIFPSKLETWGLPLSEAKEHRVPVLSADLAYAHETLGNYSAVNFFDSDSSSDLLKKLDKTIKNDYEGSCFVPSNHSMTSWTEFADFILGDLKK